MYLYFSSVEQFDFSEMLDKTIKNYSPNDMTAEKKEELIQKLCDLPEKQHFDHQFKPVLSMIKPKMKKRMMYIAEFRSKYLVRLKI